MNLVGQEAPSSEGAGHNIKIIERKNIHNEYYLNGCRRQARYNMSLPALLVRTSNLQNSQKYTLKQKEKIKPHGKLVSVSLTGFPCLHLRPINVVVYDMPLGIRRSRDI